MLRLEADAGERGVRRTTKNVGRRPTFRGALVPFGTIIPIKRMFGQQNRLRSSFGRCTYTLSTSSWKPVVYSFRASKVAHHDPNAIADRGMNGPEQLADVAPPGHADQTLDAALPCQRCSRRVSPSRWAWPGSIAMSTFPGRVTGVVHFATLQFIRAPVARDASCSSAGAASSVYSSFG